ncbi:MAG: hypothetical protein ACW98Y_01465 [Candidatus Thorarchaeota archaeon]|jgi:hypothetical protein
MRKSFIIGVAAFAVIILVQLMLYYQEIDVLTRVTNILLSLVALGIIIELFRSDDSDYGRVLEMGLYLLLVGSSVLAVYFLYTFFVDTSLIWGFVFAGLPCGVVFLVGLFLTFYGIHLKDKAGKLNW